MVTNFAYFMNLQSHIISMCISKILPLGSCIICWGLSLLYPHTFELSLDLRSTGPYCCDLGYDCECCFLVLVHALFNQKFMMYISPSPLSQSFPLMIN